MFLVSKLAGYVSSGMAQPEVYGPPSPGAGGQDFDLSQGLTLASMGASIFATREKAQAEEMQAQYESRALMLSAREQELEAQREETRGKQAANQLLDDFRQTIASQRLAFAGNGVMLGPGTPDSVADSARALADRQLSTTRIDSRISALARRRQASALVEESGNTRRAGKATARNTRLAGAVDAIGSAQRWADRREQRG
jgi:hypothetical protein